MKRRNFSFFKPFFNLRKTVLHQEKMETYKKLHFLTDLFKLKGKKLSLLFVAFQQMSNYAVLTK